MSNLINREFGLDDFIVNNTKYISDHTEIEKIDIKGDVIELQLWFHGNGVHYTMIFSEIPNFKLRDTIDWDRVIEILTLMIYFSVGEFGKPSSAKMNITNESNMKEGTVIFQKTLNCAETKNIKDISGRVSLFNSSRDFWDNFWEEQLNKKK